MVATRHARERWKELTTAASAAFLKYRYNEAEELLKQALPMVLDRRPHLVAGVLEDLSAIYIETHRYEAAKLVLDKVVEILENLEPDREIDALLAMVGLRYEQMGLYEPALRLCKQRQTLVRGLKEPVDVKEYLMAETEEELERIRRDKHEHDELIGTLMAMLDSVPIQLHEVTSCQSADS